MTERSLRLPDFLDHILTAIQRMETCTRTRVHTRTYARHIHRQTVFQQLEKPAS